MTSLKHSKIEISNGHVGIQKWRQNVDIGGILEIEAD
jgi:hypothetical protein